MREFFEIVLGTQSGMDVEAFREISRKWLAEAKHPRWDRLHTELVYQPMIEVLNYLRANGYRTFIATGGSAGFVREYAEKVTASSPSRSLAPSRRSSTATTRTTGPFSPGSPS
jgi:phosphoserine phosphatase